MDFILGIFTGISLTFSFAFYLRHKKQKEQEAMYKEREKVFWNSFWAGYRGANLTKEDMQYINHSDELYRKTSLTQRLEQAIESENFEEAARIRDLINKQ